jgi:DNA (cytosine-5)-methyltransferase 1
MLEMSPRKPSIRVLDLFAGAGGLTAGFRDASTRFETVRAVEMDLAAAASYEATFGGGLVYAGPIQRWLESEPVPEVDIVVGGPPCQGFSALGRQDVQDSRNFLWEEYAKTVARARPRYFVVENVPQFAQSSQYQDFVAATAAGGLLQDYDFQFKVLNSADYGAPQARKRTVIIGHRRDLEFPGFPEPTRTPQTYATVRQAFNGIRREPNGVELPPSDGVRLGGKTFAGAYTPSQLHLGRNYAKLSKDRFDAIPIGGNRFDLPHDLLAPCWVNHKSGSGDVMGRLHWDRPSVTIRTEFFKPEKGRYLHPVENRAITHYEAARLQGFPETHQFVGSKTAIAKQIGNAVPIPLAAAIARQLVAAL